MEALFIKKYITKLLPFVFCLLPFALISQIQAKADCIDAIRLCDANMSTYFEVNGVGEIDDANGALGLACQNQTSADQWESDSAWFIFTPKYSGQLGFYICPDIEEDWEFIVFGPNTDCTDLNNAPWVICNTTSPGISEMACTGSGAHPTQGGNGAIQGFETYMDVTANETYILFTSPFLFGGGANHKATLTFQGDLVNNFTDTFDHPDCHLSVLDYQLSKAVTISPNPFTTNINIKSSVAISTISLFSISGQKIFTKAFSNTIDVSTLASGVYFLQLQDDKGNTTVKRLVKK